MFEVYGPANLLCPMVIWEISQKYILILGILFWQFETLFAPTLLIIDKKLTHLQWWPTKWVEHKNLRSLLKIKFADKGVNHSKVCCAVEFVNFITTLFVDLPYCLWSSKSSSQITWVCKMAKMTVQTSSKIIKWNVLLIHIM